MNPEKITELRKLIIDLESAQDYKEILACIFEYHLLENNKQTDINNIVEHLASSFQFDVKFMMEYLSTDEYVTKEHFDNLENVNRDSLDFINKLKRKYGYIIKNLIQKNRNPFMLSGVDINVKKNGSLHNLRIFRTDGEELALNFDANNLMMALLALTQALNNSVTKGIFSLDEKVINNYIQSINEMHITLEKLIKHKSE